MKSKREFYGRHAQLQELQRRYASLTRGELVIVYGRRRLGKSELAREFIERASATHVSFTIPESSRQDVFEHIERDLERSLQVTRVIRNWDDLFSEICTQAKKGKVVVVFDEVQRLYDIDRAFFSDLQHWWDQELKHLPVFFVMIGSVIGLMHKVFLSPASPLFSRKTWSYKIEPFTYAEMRLMFAHLGEGQRIEIYSVFGGTPAYLAHVKAAGDADILSLINSLCLLKGAPLYDEPYILLKTELKRSERYNAILHAVAKGKVSQKEMANMAGLDDPNKINPYVETIIQDLHIIERSDPVGGKRKSGRYSFTDSYFHFWYRYIHSAQSLMEMGNTKMAMEEIKEDLPKYLGQQAELLVRELIKHFNGSTQWQIPMDFSKVGAWWERKGDNEHSEEIDLVAVAKHWVLLGEVEWKKRTSDKSLLTKLLRKSKRFPLRMPQKYVLISKQGFDNGCAEAMAAVGCIGITLSDISLALDAE